MKQVPNLSREELLIELQSKFRKNIRGAGLIYMALYDVIEARRPVTPEALAAAVYMPLTWVMKYEYVWSKYIN